MNKGFFQYGPGKTALCDDPTYEDFLVADRKGLEFLRSKIDEILENPDEVLFLAEESITDLNGIKLSSRTEDPYASEDSGELAMASCLIIALAVASMLVMGVWKTYELIVGS